MPTKKIKISELPKVDSYEGLSTIGINANNESVCVPLKIVEDAANYAREEGDKAAVMNNRVTKITPIVMSEAEFEKLTNPDPERIYYIYEEEEV